MNTLYLDLETYCETKITHGAYRYAEDAEVMLVERYAQEQGLFRTDATPDPEYTETLVLKFCPGMLLPGPNTSACPDFWICSKVRIPNFLPLACSGPPPRLAPGSGPGTYRVSGGTNLIAPAGNLGDGS